MSRLSELIEELCPDGVEYKALGDIGQVAMCKRVMKSDTNTEGGVPFYKIGTFGGIANAYIPQELFEKYKELYSYPKKGDVLLSAAGTIGKTVIFDGKPAYFQDSNIVWLEHDETKILNKFLFYVYETKPWKISNGGTIARIYNNNIRSAKVPVPPLEVQREIVRVLDSFVLLTAELTTELTARKKQYEYYKQVVFNNKMKYQIKHITDIALVKARVGWQRLTRAEYLQKGEYCLITGTDFTKGGYIDFDNCVYVTKERFEMDENIIVHKNDVLITKDGTLGKVAFIEEEPQKPTTLNSGVFRIKITDDEVLPKYMYYFFTSKYFTDFIDGVKTGSTIPHLTQQGLVTLDIPIPTIEEQSCIVNILDRFNELCNSISSGLPSEIEARRKQYEYYRDKLLTFKAVVK